MYVNDTLLIYRSNNYAQHSARMERMQMMNS